MCLKTENCYLKTFIKIRVGEKKSDKICKMLFKNWKWLFENINQTSHTYWCFPLKKKKKRDSDWWAVQGRFFV